MVTLQERTRFLDDLVVSYFPQNRDARIIAGFILSYVAVADRYSLKEVYVKRKAGIPQEELARARRNLFVNG